MAMRVEVTMMFIVHDNGRNERMEWWTLCYGGTGSKSCCHQEEEANVANKIRGRGNIVKCGKQ